MKSAVDKLQEDKDFKRGGKKVARFDPRDFYATLWDVCKELKSSL